MHDHHGGQQHLPSHSVSWNPSQTLHVVYDTIKYFSSDVQVRVFCIDLGILFTHKAASNIMFVLFFSLLILLELLFIVSITAPS